MGSHAERGYTSPPVSANQRSSGRDRQATMTPKTLRHNTPMHARILHIFGINLQSGLPNAHRRVLGKVMWRNIHIVKP
jgi:hypothetical protein